MVGVDKSDPNNNPCVDNKFPAASIFKIVTAAAAIETCRFNESIMLPYTGNQHTLYKGQINKRTERYAHWITLKDAFAKSVNPVFGKIGAFYLGKTGIEKYGRYFGFNKNMDFEIPMPPSNLSVSEKPFELAEVASGFNRATTITPVHGALIAGAILNGGKLMAPSVIDRIFDENQKTIYTAGEEAIGRAVKPETALIVQKLMAETVKSGTLKRSFRGYQKDRILSRLDIGGKTGSIDNSTHDTRIDWFVGYAREKNGAGELAVSVIVAHEDHIGIKSGQYARMIIKPYFQNYFANKENNYARL
jgi:cell division protein FtsI/penicillin-binding protein 2